jgi:23S rRNA (adenine-N6)-dimethyltransferase
MAKKPDEQTIPGQNFLRSASLVRALVDVSAIGSSDVVYEIGPGRGIITAELGRRAHTVVAIEKDAALAQRLHERFRDAQNVKILQGDFLSFRIPEKEYKVFANIPYHITAQVMHKLLHTGCAPCEAYLVMQKEAAQKFAGRPKTSQFSILAAPFWELRIVRELRRWDFEPVPQVESVFLQIKKRAPPLVNEKERGLYQDFIRFGFGRWKNNLKSILKPVFTYEQWKRLTKELRIPPGATPTELTFEQWLGLYECFKLRVPMNKQVRIKN